MLIEANALPLSQTAFDSSHTNVVLSVFTLDSYSVVVNLQFTLLKSRVRNYHQLAVTCRASEHPEMPQVVLLHKMPCISTSCTGTQVANHS